MDTWPLEPEESDETDPADLSTPAFFKRSELDSLRAQEEQRTAQEEWDKVTNVVGIGAVTYCSRIITYEEALCYFKEKDLSSYMTTIRPVIQRRGIKLILHCLFGPPRLKLGLVPARDFTFALAQCPFDNDNTLHLEILQTIYRKLTNTVYDCPRYGSHWERIGFQGNDPATDLRGVGVLGILHLLFLTTGFGNIELVNDIYSLSRDRDQNFPFALMSLNITKMSIEALREEVLNRCCNERNDVTHVVNEFYAGTFLLLYLSWKNKKLTIKDSGFILKDTSFFAKKKPGFVLRNLREYQEEQSSLTTSQVFTNLAAIEAQ
ncbi:ELMO domain-containing protein 3 isoform X1 [Rhipicephalus sanguineus]|uniref:ELMO domain-containing protein 3 isoform X1 n=2 Tax=Rhipicephalus sanguineus TaxID=34632 RepID=UPI0018956D3F|nr:ELMO domain-containing protein 3 isoform X1 [Rhipicephalus sanguineus]